MALHLPQLGGDGLAGSRARMLEAQNRRAAEKVLREGMISLLDQIAPADWVVTPNFVQFGPVYAKTLFVYTYPRYLGTNWLSPIINYDITADIAMFIHPLRSNEVMTDLRKRVGQLESTMRMEEEKGLVRNPELETAVGDIEGLRDVLQRGEVRLFQFALYFTVYAATPEELTTITKQLESTLGGMLIYTKQALFQIEPGFNSTLPLGTDELQVARNLDTGSLSTTFPFTSAELTTNEGILYGLNRHNNSLVIFDRFNLENANSVVFSKSGGGKSLKSSAPVLIKGTDGRITTKAIGQVVDELVNRRGAVAIDDEMEGVLQPGIDVWGFDRKMKTGWQRVTVAARKAAPKTLYAIETASGRRIDMTADHNLVYLDRGRVVMSRPASVVGRPSTALPLTRKIDCDVPRALAGLPFPPRRSRELWSATEISVSPTTLRLFGYLLAEGHVTARRVMVSNIDPLVLNQVARGFQELGLAARPMRGAAKRITALYVDSVRLAKTTTDWGLGQNSGNKRLPGWFWQLNNQQAAEFLKAYFEGDGGVEDHIVNATTKSRQLASDLAYALLRFGIIARIRKTMKRATNGTMRKKLAYWRIVISGRDQIARFNTEIGFVTAKKQAKLAKLLKAIPDGNTNVDVVPTLEPLFEEIYRVLYRGEKQKAPQTLLAIKRGVFAPSPTMISELLVAFNDRAHEIIRAGTRIGQIQARLPALRPIIEQARTDRTLNRDLWSNLGQTWRLVKNATVSPSGATLAVRILNTSRTSTITMTELKTELRQAFDALGVSLQQYNKTLWAWTQNHHTGTWGPRYATIRQAFAYVQTEYHNLTKQLEGLKPTFALLYQHARSDLFWDPIVSIKKIPCRDQYVYDLTVDDEVFLAGEGGLFVHNSYAVKLEALRSLMWGTDIIVIDPENEYKLLAEAVGGSYLDLSLNSTQRINPFDLSPILEGQSGEEILRSAIVMVHGLLKLMLGGLNPEEDALLDRALYETYAVRDITTDPASHQNPPPLMGDLQAVLQNISGAESLVRRLEKYTTGTFAGLFNQPTNFDLNRGFVGFSVRDLEEQLRPIGMYLILGYIWNKIKHDIRRRILIIDEAWLLMQNEDSAKFVFSLAKRARKYYLGLTIISQDVEDMITSQYGRAVVTNSSLTILLKQAPSAADRLSQVFNLTEGEKFLLLEADVGEGLFFAGLNHVAIKIISSFSEDQMITTDPRQLLAFKQTKQAEGSGDQKSEIGGQMAMTTAGQGSKTEPPPLPTASVPTQPPAIPPQRDPAPAVANPQPQTPPEPK